MKNQIYYDNIPRRQIKQMKRKMQISINLFLKQPVIIN